MVGYLNKLKLSDWSNSIVDLAEGNTIEDGDIILLWNQNAQFDALFMAMNNQQDRSPTSPKQRARRSATKENSTPTRGEKLQVGKKPCKDRVLIQRC